MYKFLKKPYTLAGFEPGIFCSVGERDDKYATPPWRRCQSYWVVVPFCIRMAEVCNISTSYFFVSMPQTNVIIFHR
jgi:hypothetical protein